MTKEKNQPQEEEILKNEEVAAEEATQTEENQAEETAQEETPAEELTVEEQLYRYRSKSLSDHQRAGACADREKRQ